jgi:hypothetical protein
MLVHDWSARRWDLIVRFASDPALKEEEFYSDFVEIADQEVSAANMKTHGSCPYRV